MDLSVLGIVRMGLEKFKPDMGNIRKSDISENGESCMKERLVGLCNVNR